MTPPTPAPFAGACGQHRPLRLAVEDAAGDRIAEGDLDQPFALIGADPGCEVALAHPSIPDRVAFLQVIDGNVLVVELTGYAVHRLTPESPLPLGPFTLHLLTPPSAGPPAPLGDPFRDEQPGRRLPRVRLASLTGRGLAHRVIGRRLTFLGGGPDSPTDAPPLAYLTLTPAGLFATDLRSVTGTRVNGQLVRAALLAEGDELHVGKERYAIQADEVPLLLEVPRAAGPLPTALLGGDARANDPAGRAARRTPALDAPIPLLPLTAGRPSANLPARSDPAFESVLRQVSALQCELLDRLRRELDLMVADFDHLTAEQLVAFGEELARLRDVSAQLARPPAPSGVTTLSAQPVELLHDAPPFEPTGHDSRGDGWGPPSADTAAVHQAMYERLTTMSGDRPGLWRRLRGLLGRGDARE